MAILAECPTCHKRQKNKNKRCVCGKNLDSAKRAENPKNKVKYWIVYTVAGKQRWEPVGYDLEEAKLAESKRKVQRFENPRILQKAPEERMTFQQLTDWYLGLEKVKGLRYYRSEKIDLAAFNREFGNYIISNIKSMDIENYQAKRKRECKADATVDHEVGAAKRVALKAFDNDMLTGETVKVFKRVKKMLKLNANARDRILSMEEFEELFRCSPPHIRVMLALGFYGGMRRGEIVGLTWGQIDLKNRTIKLAASDTKDREPRTIPISDELYDLLRQIPRALHDPHVLLYEGKPVVDTRKALKRACTEAGIVHGRGVKGGFIFHDTRHCFNTYARKAGVPESVIMAITGHSTRSMFDRYNTIDGDDLRQAVGQMGSYLHEISKNVSKKSMDADGEPI